MSLTLRSASSSSSLRLVFSSSRSFSLSRCRSLKILSFSKRCRSRSIRWVCSARSFCSRAFNSFDSIVRRGLKALSQNAGEAVKGSSGRFFRLNQAQPLDLKLNFGRGDFVCGPLVALAHRTLRTT